MSMANEFDESEMYPCDICKEGYPREDMIELPDGTLLCPDCLLCLKQFHAVAGHEEFRGAGRKILLYPQVA